MGRYLSGFRHPMGATLAMLALLFGAAYRASGSNGSLPLKAIADAPLTGHSTRWDYASLDPVMHRLYIAHLGDSVVTVFDTQRRQVLVDIPQVSHVHGVLAIPELGRVYASATGTNEVVSIDMTTHAIRARIPAGNYPDGLAYAPVAHKLYVSDEHGGTVTVIDVRSDTRVATIPLSGEVGNTQYDPVSEHVFSNAQTQRQLVEIDPLTDKIVTRTELPGAEANHGLYIDAPARLAFIACEGNAKLLVLDLTLRRVVATFDVGKDPDVLAFDTTLGWLYVASESGEVSVLAVKGRTVSLLGTAWLGPDAHVVTVDPATHLAYFPLKSGSTKEPVLRIMQAQAGSGS